MKKYPAIIFFILSLSAIAAAQETNVKWNGDTKTKLTDRTAEMKFTVDAKGLKSFSFYTSFYFHDTQNFHECDLDFSRDDNVSKWTTNGNVTKIIDKNGEETIFTKTKLGFIVDSGCGNTTYHKVSFVRRGKSYVGRKIKR